MSKKRRRLHIGDEFALNEPNGPKDEYLDEAMQIKMEPIDIGYQHESMELIPTKTIIYNGNDGNGAAVEAEIGLESQLDFIKSEVNVDDATIMEFREEMRRVSYGTANDEINEKQLAKKRKREVEQKKVQQKVKKSKKNVVKKEKITDEKDKSVELQPLDIVVNEVKMAKCRFCDFQLTSRNRSIVKEHMRLHTGVTPFHCKHCSQKFITRNFLVHHIRRNHPTIKQYKCELCRMWFFSGKDIESHEFKCVKRRSFECHLCKHKIKRLQMHLVNEHMRKEHTGEMAFRCEYCNETFITRGQLKNHVKHHPDAIHYKCDICNEIYATAETLKKHVGYCLTRRRFECHICQYACKKLGFKGLRMHMRKHTGEKPFQCQFCKKFYPRSEALAQHVQRHRDLFKFKCSRCHRRCFSAVELTEHENKCRKRRYECYLCGFTKFGLSHNKFRRHFALKHIGERSYLCGGCSASFSSATLLARHITENHPKLLAFICPNCNCRCSSRAARDKHQAMCMKRRIECYICKMTCKTMETLRTHMVTRHTGEAKFHCHLCSKKYISEVNYKIHIKSHSNVGLSKCNYCSKEFSHNKYRKKHEFQCKKSYECCLCKKVFPSFVILRDVHMRTHLGAKPYKCTHCPKRSVSIRMHNLHVIAAHLHEYKFKCNKCNETISQNKDVLKHRKSCLKPIRKAVGIFYFKCALCRLDLGRVPELRKHILNSECTKHPRKNRKK